MKRIITRMSHLAVNVKCHFTWWYVSVGRGNRLHEVNSHKPIINKNLITLVGAWLTKLKPIMELASNKGLICLLNSAVPSLSLPSFVKCLDISVE